MFGQKLQFYNCRTFANKLFKEFYTSLFCNSKNECLKLYTEVYRNDTGTNISGLQGFWVASAPALCEKFSPTSIKYYFC